MAPVLLSLLFAPPPSLFVTAMSVISFVALSLLGLSEVLDRHLQYSKFWTASPVVEKSSGIVVPGRAGMFVLYAPALAAAAASFAIPGVADASLRTKMLCSALAFHFFKRVFEVLFIHQYSGKMILDSAIPISLSYLISTVSMIYTQYLSRDMPEPELNLKYAGVVLFLIGIGGNFYHHYLLSKLRKKGDKEYKIPQGGLFGLVICPHYLFEIIGFIGISFISQTVYACSFTLGTIFYLTGRSYATRKWYLSKFDDFPTKVKALVPFIF